jgi:signal transduction histidine kinase
MTIDFPFSRGDRPSQQGLGLGLFIASEIARAHALTADSTIDETTFVFSVPQALTRANAATRPLCP